MAKKLINQVNVVGYLYEHDLKESEVKNKESKNYGNPFIMGSISVATDEEMMNVITINYRYVAPRFNSGKENTTYNTLTAIIDGKVPNVIEHGKENAAKVRVSTSIALNEWFDSKTNYEELISNKRNEGGFVHVLTMAEEANYAPEASFEADFLVTKAIRKEADTEKNLPEKMILKGYAFGYQQNGFSLLPLDFSLYSPGAMDYFENQEPSTKNPFFTKVKGREISQTIVRKIEEEGAFGEVSVREVTSSQRDFEVTWATKTPYEWDSEETMTAEEFKNAQNAREIYLNDMKKRQIENAKNKEAGAFSGASAPATPKKSDYDF